MTNDQIRKSPLNKKRVVDAAIELVAEHGLDGLSMRRLAGHLDAGTMSLYNHVPNKDTLLDAMVEKILQNVIGDERAEDPLERLRHVCLSLREAAMGYPEIFRIIAIRPPSPSLLRLLEIELENLDEFGFDPSTTANALRILFGYVFGYIRLETGGFYAELGRLKDDLPDLDSDGYPGIAAASHHLASWAPEVEFQQGLDAILAGLKKTPPVPGK